MKKHIADHEVVVREWQSATGLQGKKNTVCFVTRRTISVVASPPILGHLVEGLARYVHGDNL
jgi:vacuolar-type H+-ATPase subunit B/Vma2